jgi:hypothetical protein
MASDGKPPPPSYYSPNCLHVIHAGLFDCYKSIPIFTFKPNKVKFDEVVTDNAIDTVPSVQVSDDNRDQIEKEELTMLAERIRAKLEELHQHGNGSESCFNRSVRGILTSTNFDSARRNLSELPKVFFEQPETKNTQEQQITSEFRREYGEIVDLLKNLDDEIMEICAVRLSDLEEFEKDKSNSKYRLKPFFTRYKFLIANKFLQNYLSAPLPDPIPSAEMAELRKKFNLANTINNEMKKFIQANTVLTTKWINLNVDAGARLTRKLGENVHEAVSKELESRRKLLETAFPSEVGKTKGNKRTRQGDQGGSQGKKARVSTDKSQDDSNAGEGRA